MGALESSTMGQTAEQRAAAEKAAEAHAKELLQEEDAAKVKEALHTLCVHEHQIHCSYQPLYRAKAEPLNVSCQSSATSSQEIILWQKLNVTEMATKLFELHSCIIGLHMSKRHGILHCCFGLCLQAS